MALFQAAEVKLSSGVDPTFFATLSKVQNVSINYNVSRSDIYVLGKTKPLNQRPVLNYIPVNYSVDIIKSQKDVEDCLGLLNSTGVGMAFGNTSSPYKDFGIRNLDVFLLNNSNGQYLSQASIKSGFLTSYKMNSSVGQPTKVSFAGEALDFIVQSNNYFTTTNNSIGDLIKSEGVFISGIDFSGVGVTGYNIQSIDLSIQFNRQNILRFGQRLPEKPVSEIKATLNVNGFIENLVPDSGLSKYNCGDPVDGSLFITLIPSCSTTPATTYTITNPYLESFSFGAQVGNYISVEMGFSIPIPFSYPDALTGSNIVIS